MEQANRVTTLPRALMGLLAGAVTGALVFFLEIAALLALRPAKLPEMSEYVGMDGVTLILIIALSGFIFFAGGLLIAGAPAWWLLHRLGRRDWFYAAGMGALLGCAGFVFMALWNAEWPALMLISFLTEEFGGLTARGGQLTGEGWAALVRGALGIAFAGALAGMALWKVAYRNPRITDSKA